MTNPRIGFNLLMEKAKESNVLFLGNEPTRELSQRLAQALAGGSVRAGQSASTNLAVKSNLPSQLNPALGRNFLEDESDIVAAVPGEAPVQGLSLIPVNEIAISPFQVRSIIEAEELEELKRSIAEQGVIQPIIVRSMSNSERPFELVAGERRLRAAIALGLVEIPAIARVLTDAESLQLAIIENAQRENLNPVDEARGYKRLIDEFKFSQTEVAERIGKSRVAISNALRLLHLPEEVLAFLITGELSAGHGRALLMLNGVADAEKLQLRLAKRAIKAVLSVRALEELVERIKLRGANEEMESAESPEELSLKRAEKKLGSYLGVERVRLRLDNAGRRQLQVTFDTEVAWKRFMSKVRD